MQVICRPGAGVKGAAMVSTVWCSTAEETIVEMRSFDPPRKAVGRQVAVFSTVAEAWCKRSRSAQRCVSYSNVLRVTRYRIEEQRQNHVLLPRYEQKSQSAPTTVTTIISICLFARPYTQNTRPSECSRPTYSPGYEMVTTPPDR
jgi:hypothetical protein